MSAVSAVAALLVALTTSQATPREAPSGASAADAAIVRELRALRESVERFMTANVRVQLLMGRLQLQEARIQTIARQATDLDAQVVQLTRERDEVTRQQSAMQRMSKQAPDAEEREEFRRQAVGFGEQLKHIEARLAVVGADLTAVQQALATEQNRWGEFNGRLEELERELRRP